MALHMKKILDLLRDSPGLSAKEIAIQLDIDRKDINKLLYGNLQGQVWQDNSYKWHITDNSSIEIGEVKNVPLTDLARLCRYYLACLGQDDIGISTFAQSNYDDLDYGELNSLPQSTEKLLSEESCQRLLGKIRSDRSRLEMYLGYPTHLRHFKSARWEGYFVEPIFIFPIEIDPTNKTTTLDISYPIINQKILKSFTNSEKDGILDELVQLEQELGIGGEAEIIELDELVMRLQNIRAEWPWSENIDPTEINSESQKLSETNTPGIYNKAIVIVTEKSPYTKGLESELTELSKCSTESLKGTALGTWLSGNRNSNKKIDEENSLPLIEVLPMNSEQRQSVYASYNNDLTTITGPPGTGKSQVVTNLLINAAWQGKKVLFASKNNKAVDVVETRVNNLGPRPILLRVGSNAYQAKLAEYLMALLSTVSTEDDQFQFDEAEIIHSKLLKQLHSLDEDVVELIENRNQVDELEQSVEEIRFRLDDKIFLSFKTMDISNLKADIKILAGLVMSLNKNKVTFWFFRKNGLLRAANMKLKQATQFAENFGLSNPHNQITESNISDWRDFVNQLEEEVNDAESVSKYFIALDKLQSTKNLEDISLERQKLFQEIATNSETLWKLWLRLQPKRLSQEDRDKLAKYRAILEMVIDTDPGERLKSKVFSEYKKIFKQVSHLLPCWAVTSLSAKGKLAFEPGDFDIVVFDEASQCDIASALPLLYRAKTAVIIGDPQQLSHISGLRRGQDQQLLDKFDLISDYPQWGYSYNSLFALASGLSSQNSVVNLVDHHRSHSDVIEFSNKEFYQGRLRVATKYDNLQLVGSKEPGVRWINVQGRSEKPANGSGSINLQEVKAVVDELVQLVLSRSYKGSVGVVSPFRAQANAIRVAVENHNELSRTLIDRKFLVDTVHKFQGDERDVMVFSPVLSQGMPLGSILFLKNNGNLFNVAITRARAQLIVVGDLSECGSCDVDYLSKFAQYSQNLIHSTDEIKQTNELEYGGSEYPVVNNPEQVSDWERHFYTKLHKAGLKTLPQYRVEKYALDLAIIDGERKLDIEVDGEKYHKNWNGELCRRDQMRNQRLYELGWDVMRFWVYQIRDDLPTCIEKIKKWQAKSKKLQ